MCFLISFASCIVSELVGTLNFGFLIVFRAQPDLENGKHLRVGYVTALALVYSASHSILYVQGSRLIQYLEVRGS